MDKRAAYAYNRAYDMITARRGGHREDTEMNRVKGKEIGQRRRTGFCRVSAALLASAVLLAGCAQPAKEQPVPEMTEAPAALTPSPEPIPTPTPEPSPTPVPETDETRYQAAQELYDAGDFDAALDAFLALGDYEDSAERAFETKLARFRALCEQGQGYEAATACYALYLESGDQRAWDCCFELWGLVAPRETVSAGVNYTVGVRSDGTVVATGRNKVGQCNVQGWREVAAVSAGGWHPLALRFDGTVVAAGSDYFGQCRVGDWTDIVSISGGSSHSVGLRADGTAVAVGFDRFGQCQVSGWTDLIAVAAGCTHTVGLRRDGSVVAVGANDYGQCDVEGWTDIVMISASELNTVGLRADGTVVAAGSTEFGQCEVGEWKDIVAVSTYANSVRAGDEAIYFAHTVGLRADGTAVVTGSNLYGQSLVTEWTDLVSISAGGYHTAALRADGTAVATEITDPRGNGGQCDVGGWHDLALPPRDGQ